MITTRAPHVVRIVALVGAATLVLYGCTEPVASKSSTTPEKIAEAQLILSDSAPVAGRTVDVFAQVTAATPDVVGSYTARIRYDTTALRYEQELTIADDALRATNATSGQLRFAGAAPKGLPSGRLAGYRFLVLRPNATQSLQLVVEELHTVARANAASQLRAMPNGIGVAP
ncbi:MAG: hypothetical protein ABI664_21645 [bacterium]